MTICLGKNRLFGLLCVSFVNLYQFCVCASFLFGFAGGMWDSVVLNSDNWRSIDSK